MINKKGQREMGGALVKIILVLAVIAVALFGLYKAGVLDSLRGMPDFNQTDYGREVIAEQAAVPEKEKERDYGVRYPIVRLHYTKGKNDLFAYRWNSNINEKKGDVQVVMNIVWASWVFGLSESERSKEWLINPDLNKAFREHKGLYGYEKQDVINIMNAESEEEMFERIVEAGQRKNVYIDFPEFNKDASSFFPELEKFEKLTKEQIKEKLQIVYSWYYGGSENEENENE